tara:strand:- start:1173 stop:2033 length:861 start_codon:yes stop_codon:yes gene_type:complete
MKRNSPITNRWQKDTLIDTANPLVDTSKGGWVVAGETAEKVRKSNATALLQQYSSTADKASTIKKPDIQPVSDGGFYQQGGQPVDKVGGNRDAAFKSGEFGDIEGFESRASKGEYGTGLETQNVALETGVTLGDAGVLPANGDGNMSNASNPATNALNSAGKIKPIQTAGQGTYNSPLKADALAFLNAKKPSTKGMKIDGDPDIAPLPGFDPIPGLEPPAERRRKDKEGRIGRGGRKERGEPDIRSDWWYSPDVGGGAEGRPEKGGRNRRKGGMDFGNARPFGGVV